MEREQIQCSQLHGLQTPQGREGGKREEDRKRGREGDRKGGVERGRERDLCPRAKLSCLGEAEEFEEEENVRVSEKHGSLCFPEIGGWVSLSGITLGTIAN